MSALGAFREIVLAGTPAELEAFAAGLSGPVRVIANARKRYAVDLPFRWPKIAGAVGAPHLTWFPHWDGAWTADRPVTTLHDLIQLDALGIAGMARRTVARAWIGKMIAVSRGLITGSEASARDFGREFPESAERLRVIPHGVAEIFFDSDGAPQQTPDAFIALGAAWSRGDGLDTRPPFLLAVANKKPHKNLAMAVRVLARLAASQENAALRLVLIGERFAHGEELKTLARKLGVADRVDDIERLPDEALAWAYSHTEALLVPSRIEGFGMVALEAMACGAPVVVVDRPPLPEVVGSAAAVVALDDDAAMAAAVQRLRSDNGYRAERIAAGRARAGGFTWKRTAERTAEVLLSR